MQLKEIIGLVNDPVIILNDENLGNLSQIYTIRQNAIFNKKVVWVEGVGTGKEIAIYIE